MNNFLKDCRKIIKSIKPFHVVIGNESCDLDSAVSTLCLAYHLNNRLHSPPTIPVLNIPRIELPLKTEVVFFLKENEIILENLICLDEVDMEIVPKIALVDHHVSKYWEKIFLVLDHRPVDPTANFPDDCRKIIEAVGSCATLVLDYIQKEDSETLRNEKELLTLLYGPIIVDTVNFSKDADRARPLDHKMVEQIENSLEILQPLQNRVTLFNNLVDARNDMSHLTALQILNKDLKIVTNRDGEKIVSLPGFPVLVEDFIKRSDFSEAIQIFARNSKSNVVLLIGLQIMDGRVQRDIGVINVNNDNLYEEILNGLLKSEEFAFDFHENHNSNLNNGRFFKQGNLKLSRKQILPIVKTILNKN